MVIIPRVTYLKGKSQGEGKDQRKKDKTELAFMLNTLGIDDTQKAIYQSPKSHNHFSVPATERLLIQNKNVTQTKRSRNT